MRTVNSGIAIRGQEGVAHERCPWLAAAVMGQMALGVAAGSFAAAPAVPMDSSSAEASAAQNSPSDVGNDQLDVVTVTAQKREERLQDVPISIAVMGGDQLDQATYQGTTEALSRVPGMAVAEAPQGGGTQLVMRGVTAGGPVFTGSSPISYYLDSVPFGLVRQAIVPDVNAFDLARIEALRGPQGTLYGASAQNGVVRVLTKDANPAAFEFKARTAASSTEDGGGSYRGDLAVNVPIIDGKLAARAVLGYQNSGGWIDRPNKKEVNDSEIRSLRLKVKGNPTEQLSIGLSGWFSRADYGSPSSANNNQRRRALLSEPISTDTDAYALTIGYDLAAFSISSATSYLKYTNDSSLDLIVLGVPNTASDTLLEADVFSQEIILNSSSGGAWRWSLGGIYRDAEDLQFQQTVPGGRPPVTTADFTYTSKSSAVFGELTRRFLDGSLELTGGLRYFEDKVNLVEHSNAANLPRVRSESTFDALSPRVVLTWHPNEQTNLYASYAEGFRSGLDQAPPVKRAAPSLAPLDADTLTNYELGAKGSLLEGRLTYETALYFIDWQDVQQSMLVPNPVPGAQPVTALINGESASGAGLDLGVTLHPSDALDLGLSVSWNDLAIDGNVVATGVLLFAKGDRLNLSPEYTASAWAGLTAPLGGSGYEGQLSLSATYTSAMDARTVQRGARVLVLGDSMFIGRASFAIKAPEHWTATLFIDNVTDEDGISAPFAFAGVPDFDGRARPRTLGLQFEFAL